MDRVYEDDNGLRGEGGTVMPLFHLETRVDEEASRASGKKIYKEVPYVEVIIPGNDKERVNRPVEERDKQRWPDQWRRFEQSGFATAPVDIDGFPVEEWPQVNAAQAMTLKSSNIFTVEQLAEVPDVDIQGLGMGMMDLKYKARVFLDVQRGELSVQKAAAKTRKYKKQVDALEKRVTELQTRLEELEGSTG